MRKITVYNTLTRGKEEFKPLEEGKVGIYVCGVTPYNDPHIGNARPFVTWDTIRRFFARCGYQVRYIQNFTDVDDKIIRAANENNVTWKDIADKYIDAYKENGIWNYNKMNFYKERKSSDVINLLEEN